MKKVLWIEDNTDIEFNHLIAPVLLSGRYDLEVAHDATEALEKLSVEHYDVVIFDLDLMPGRNEYLRAFYQDQAGVDISGKNLGGELLRLWLGLSSDFDEEMAAALSLPDHRKLNKNSVGVLSVLADDFKNQNFFPDLELIDKVVVQKDYDTERDVLLALIEKVARQAAGEARA